MASNIIYLTFETNFAKINVTSLSSRRLEMTLSLRFCRSIRLLEIRSCLTRVSGFRWLLELWSASPWEPIMTIISIEESSLVRRLEWGLTRTMATEWWKVAVVWVLGVTTATHKLFLYHPVKLFKRWTAESTSHVVAKASLIRRSEARRTSASAIEKAIVIKVSSLMWMSVIKSTATHAWMMTKHFTLHLFHNLKWIHHHERMTWVMLMSEITTAHHRMKWFLLVLMLSSLIIIVILFLKVADTLLYIFFTWTGWRHVEEISSAEKQRINTN